ncbi:T9SS type A sorting domain-containing protein [Flavobacterium crassostreae]|nr:T9SS type A sorting domain-containing protein [Flavobacterium crassostreae]
MGFSQNKLSWQGYFSYNEIKDVAASNTALYAASENALFSVKTSTNEIKTTTTLDGLSGQTISAMYYSAAFNKRVVGYQNGLLTVLNESDNTILKVVDIISKQLPANVKKINDFMEYEGILYISCDFGIVQFNLKTMLFGDTYFIGNNGAQLQVRQTAILGAYIYAATNNGIRRALVANKNLNDYQQWTQVAADDCVAIRSFDTDLVAINTSGFVYKYNSNSNLFVGFTQLPQPAVALYASADYMVITTAKSLYLYNRQFVLLRQIDNKTIPGITSDFTCATSIAEKLYIGTKADGLLVTTLATSSGFESVTPMGPLRNSIFALENGSDFFWAVYGDYSGEYNPYDLDSYGISKFSKEGWLNIPYSEVLGAKSIVRVLINPTNENQVYMGSSYSGLLKIENNVPTFLYNQTNSGLDEISFIPGYNNDVRVNGGVFDASGNLWLNNSLVKEGLKVFKTNGQWQSYPIDKVLDKSEDVSYGRMAIDKYGTKWLATNRDGVIGFNESSNTFKKITFGPDTGNLPYSDARVAAVDTNGQLWIGTTKGLRVLSSVANFKTDKQLTTSPIIILEDKLAQELLYEQFITDIVVDGANNKWIGTADSGVFMVSEDGKETKYHFTINNSPLPSNGINDIAINKSSGEVFIATDKGMISFRGLATSANQDLSKVYVYPNPVRPEYTGEVKISGLVDQANIKITDVTGNLVFETTAEGGTVAWDTTAFGKYKVASGVYMIFISAEDGIETKVKKVMIIR